MAEKSVTTVYGHDVTVPGPWRSIADIEKANKAIGNHWFDADTKRFFGSRLGTAVYAGRFFISSEQPPYGPRAYAVRAAMDDGSVETIGEVCQYTTREDAIRAIKEMLAL